MHAVDSESGAGVVDVAVVDAGNVEEALCVDVLAGSEAGEDVEGLLVDLGE